MQVSSSSELNLNLDLIPVGKENAEQKNKVGKQLIKKQESEQNQQFSYESSSISSALDHDPQNLVAFKLAKKKNLSSLSDQAMNDGHANQEPENQGISFDLNSVSEVFESELFESQVSKHEENRNNLFKDSSSLSRPPVYEEVLKKKSFWEKCCGCFQKK